MTLSQSSEIKGKIIESSIENHEKIMSHLKAAAQYLEQSQHTVHIDGPYKRVSGEMYPHPPLKQK